LVAQYCGGAVFCAAAFFIINVYCQRAQIALLRKSNDPVAVGRIANPTYALANMADDFSVCKRKKNAVYAHAQYIHWILTAETAQNTCLSVSA
jgi:hypothetical protein